MTKYDVAIIGGGICGLMTAYGLLEKNKNLKIIIFDKGHSLEERRCPIIENKIDHCVDCQPCSIMNGFAGAGAFSDGKFIISTEYGGHLQEVIGEELATSYMKRADNILVNCGATTETYIPNKTLIDLCKNNGLSIKKGIVKHFGTEKNICIMGAMIKYIEKYCVLVSNCTVKNVDPVSHHIFTDKTEVIFAEYIIFAVGRSGGNFFVEWCKNHGVKMSNNNVDIGVRVELKSEVWKKVSAIAYDPKIYYISEIYKDETRMFCFNDGGQVVIENTFDTKTVNGHAYSNPALKSENSNFALLTSIKFSEPFNNPVEYVHLLANCSNYISGGTVVVQRFGDLVRGCRTTLDKIEHSSVKPTLKAYPGDLSLCLPKRQLDSIIETIKKLDSIAPGTAADDTLLYGIEGKYYSAVPSMNDFFIDGYSKILACGDGSGITRSLAQAAANGLYIADKILLKKS